MTLAYVFSFEVAKEYRGSTPFIIEISFLGTNVKRQATDQSTVEYLSDNGGASTSCGTAGLYTIQGGLLESDGLFYSTSPGVPYQIFESSSTVGAISTSFSYSGSLTWENSAFARNPAVFCISNGDIYVIFQDVTIPNCQEVELSVIASNNGK